MDGVLNWLKDLEGDILITEQLPEGASSGRPYKQFTAEVRFPPLLIREPESAAQIFFSQEPLLSIHIGSPHIRG